MTSDSGYRNNKGRKFCLFVNYILSPLWSSGQSSWLQIQGSRFRFPALPDFLRNSGSGTGSTQPRQDNWGATWKESLENRINGRGDSLRWPRDTIDQLKLALTWPTSGGSSVGIVRWRTKAPEFACFWLVILQSPGINTKLTLIYFEMQVIKVASALREVHST
jgi:hypothetical protein